MRTKQAWTPSLKRGIIPFLEVHVLSENESTIGQYFSCKWMWHFYIAVNVRYKDGRRTATKSVYNSQSDKTVMCTSKRNRPAAATLTLCLIMLSQWTNFSSSLHTLDERGHASSGSSVRLLLPQRNKFNVACAGQYQRWVSKKKHVPY